MTLELAEEIRDIISIMRLASEDGLQELGNSPARFLGYAAGRMEEFADRFESKGQFDYE